MNLIDSLYKNNLHRGCSDEPDEVAFSRFIDSTTSPLSFDNYCRTLRQCDLEPRGIRSAFLRAVHVTNLPLTRHLVDKYLLKQGRAHQLDLGRSRCLMECASSWQNQQSNFEIAKICIQLDANVNLVVPLRLDVRPRLLEWESPLAQAATVHNLSLINMLIVNGGLLYTPFTPDQSRNVKDALHLLFNRVKPLFISKVDEGALPICRVQDVSNLVISRCIWVLAHTYLEDSLPESIEEEFVPQDEPRIESWWDSIVRVKNLISDILM